VKKETTSTIAETTNTITALIGKDLAGFKIVEMTEVYMVNTDGRKTSTLGFFRDKMIAKAFAGGQKDASYHETRFALILTDGTTGYRIESQEPVKLFDDEAEALEIKAKAAKKLSPEERSLLGIEDPDEESSD
jgi:hypothetical protein